MKKNPLYDVSKNNAEQKIRLLASLVEETSDILTASDLDFKPLTWNKAAERVFGLAAEKVLEKNLREFLTINYHNATREQVREIIYKNGEWRGEAFFTRPTDQKLITLLLGFKLMKDENENPLGYLISGIDITERKEAESRVKESENRFREMADNAPVMIWMSDENNKTTYLNKKWLAFTGTDVSGFDEHGWASFVHPDDIEEAKKKYDEGFLYKNQIVLIYRLLSKDGTYRWVHDVSVPRFLSDNSFVGYIGSLVDIQEQKSKEEQLRYQATVLENVSDIIVTTNLDFKVKTWNKVAENYYGIPEREAIEKPISDLIQFTFYDTTHEQSIIDLKSNGFWKNEVSIINKKGELHYLLQTVKYVYNEKGDKIGFLAVGRDITEAKKIEQQLIKSEQFYRTLIADSLDATLLLNADGKITFCSPAIKHILGFEESEIEGKNAFEFVHPEDLTWAFDSFQKEVIESPQIKFITIRLRKKNGEWIWCMVRGHNLLSKPNINSIVVYFHDDTLRKQASDALKESEKRFRDLIRDVQFGVILQDKEGKTILCNDAFAEMFLTRAEDLSGTGVQTFALDAVHEDGSKFKIKDRPTHKAIATKKFVNDVVMGIYRPKQQDRLWLLINADPILDATGEIIHIVCSAQNITERKKRQEEELTKQITHQKQLTQASIDAQEKERREIGKDLHDNIGQQLTTIKLFLDLAKSTADEATVEMVNMALKGVSDVINEVRSISSSLVPHTLKDLGLIDSIGEIIDSITRAQSIKIAFKYLKFEEDLLPYNQKLAIFRIVQEQLNNILKHAKANSITIRITNDPQNIILEIEDDGQGFDKEKISKGLGIANMRNRAELFGGYVKIFSEPGKGCLLHVSMPVILSQPERIMNSYN